MSCLIIKICFILIVFQCVDCSDDIYICDAELCHGLLEDAAEQFCSPKKKFVIGLNKVNWYQALEDCEMEGYRLASITSAEENANLVNYIEQMGMKDEPFWLSGNDLAKEGKFTWATAPVTEFNKYTNWNPEGEPNNLNDFEDCVLLGRGGTWNDQACYINAFYICEYFLLL